MGKSRGLHLSLHINQSLGAWLPRESMEKDQRLRIRAQTDGTLNEVVPNASVLLPGETLDAAAFAHSFKNITVPASCV